MSVDKFFIEQFNGFRKVAGKELSHNIEEWQYLIMNELFNKYPFLQNYSPATHLQITAMDEETGTAFGGLFISTPTVQISFPVIIKDFKLENFDVFEYEGKFYYTTRDRLMKLFYEHGMISQEPIPQPGTTIQPDEALPSPADAPTGFMGYRNEYSTGYSNSNMLQKMSGLISEESKREMIDSFKNPEVLAKYALANKQGVLKKLSNLAVVEKPTIEKIIPEISDVNVIGVFKEDDDKYRVLLSSDTFNKVFNKTLNYVDTIGVLKEYLENAPQMLYENNHFVIEDRLEPLIRPIILEEMVWDKEPITKGVALVEAPKGEILKGMVLPIYGYDNKKKKMHLFTNNKVYFMNENIKGELVDSDIAPYMRRATIAPNKTVSFYNPDEDCCYLPFKINTVTTKDGLLCLSGFDYYSQPVKFIVTKDLGGITPVEKDNTLLSTVTPGKAYYVPEKYLIFDLGLFIKVPSYIPSKTFIGTPYPEKTVEVISSGKQFILKGIPLKNIFGVAVLDGVNDTIAVFTLCTLGCTVDDSIRILQYAVDKGKATITNLQPFNKVAFENDMQDLQEFCDYLKVNLVKEAASVPDDSVDAILSLGLIGPENIIMLVDNLPLFQETENKLAEILVLSRLGLQTFNEEDIVKILSVLSKIIKELEALQMSIKLEK